LNLESKNAKQIDFESKCNPIEPKRSRKQLHDGCPTNHIYTKEISKSAPAISTLCRHFFVLLRYIVLTLRTDILLAFWPVRGGVMLGKSRLRCNFWLIFKIQKLQKKQFAFLPCSCIG
jgi:hypothetical protein